MTGLREDKPAVEVRRDVPHAKVAAARKNSRPMSPRSRTGMTILCESRVVGDHMPQGRVLV
jgi:hypothetical protein